MIKFEIQKYLQQLNSKKETKGKEILKDNEDIHLMNRKIKARFDCSSHLSKLEKQKGELEKTLKEHLIKVDFAHKKLAIFRKIRQDANFTTTTPTPEEHILENILEKKVKYEEQLAALLGTIETQKEALAEMLSYDEMNDHISEKSETVRKTQLEIDDLTVEISEYEKAVQCLQGQKYLESKLPGFIKFIYDNWSEHAEDWIQLFLHTEGKKKNCAFLPQQIEDCIEYIDQVFYSYGKTEEDSSIMLIDEFQKQMKELFLPELIVAFANTLYLMHFPEEFFEGDCGKVGIVGCNHPEGIYYQGVAPYKAKDTLKTLRQEIPEELQEMINQKNSYRERVFYSFKQETENKNKGQISDLQRFLKEFWRFGNIYSFDYQSQLYVHFEQQDEKEVDRDFKEYVKTRQKQGLYLNDFEP